MEREASARWMGKVLIGNPGGEPLEMGMLKYFAQRMRSMLIHLSLSKTRRFSIHTRVDICSDYRVICLLLIATGAVLPHCFIKPPRNMGTYWTSTCLNAGEFCRDASV